MLTTACHVCRKAGVAFATGGLLEVHTDRFGDRCPGSLTIPKMEVNFSPSETWESDKRDRPIHTQTVSSQTMDVCINGMHCQFIVEFKALMDPRDLPTLKLVVQSEGHFNVEVL